MMKLGDNTGRCGFCNCYYRYDDGLIFRTFFICIQCLRKLKSGLKEVRDKKENNDQGVDKYDTNQRNGS